MEGGGLLDKGLTPMSATYLRAIYKTTTPVFAVLRNSHLTHGPLWTYLGVEYCGWNPRRVHHDDWEYEALWNLNYRRDLDRRIRLALAFTADYALCPFEKKDELADACIYVHKLLIQPQVCLYTLCSWPHWQEIGKRLETLIIRGKKPPHLGMTCTSIQDLWEEPRRQWKPFDVIEHCDGVDRGEITR